MSTYNKFPEEVKEYLADLYYDGLVNDKLHPILIDGEQLVVIPDEFPDIEGRFLYDKLEDLDSLSDFRYYLNEQEIPVYFKADITEEMVEDFDKSIHRIIKESFVDDYMENNYERKMTNIIK